MENMKDNNKGFSLVELIVVVAILAIISTASFSAIGYLNLANAEKCATKIDIGLGKLKTMNMSSGSATYMHLYRYNNGYYIAFSEDDTYTPDDKGELIGNSSVTVTCGGSTLENNDVVSISVRKKDGAYTVPDVPTYTITVTNEATRKITLVTNTGKHYRDF